MPSLIAFIIPIIISATIVTVIVVSQRLGHLYGKARIHQEDRQIKLTNPYQYYKELPNSFGIGVTSLLVDAKIEDEKDIIAAILDLSAQKYLHLAKHSDHYVIRLLPDPPKIPLSNEAYILNLIRKRQLQNIDYQIWYEFCVADGIELGLFHPSKPLSHSTTPKQPSEHSTIFNIIFYLITGLMVINIVLAPFFSFAPFAFIGTVILLGLCFLFRYLYLVVARLGRASKHAFQESYKRTLERRLKRTKKGTEELQKLYAFRAFLDQFHTFVDKDPEAVVIWSRYLSYAQVFGIAPKIMQSGHSELIDNADFRIDNIDNITTQNISY